MKKHGYSKPSISFGAGGLLPGVRDLPERHQRPLKYWFVRHAERDSIYSAAQKGNSTLGSTLFVPWYSCVPCAIAIASSGVEKVVGHEAMMLKTPDRWREEIEVALQILQERGVNMYLHRGTIGGIETIMNEEKWCP